jgi:ATP-binding cassette subfamily F protein 3
MIRLLLEPVNLLILDEPTNHLDMRSKDVLKEAIKAFDGTAIIVSHDREFLDGLVTKIYEFGNKKVREHMGGIYDFLKKKKIENLNELGLSQSQAMAKDLPEEKVASENKLSYEARKELNRKIRKAEKDVEQAENAVGKLETAVSEMQHQLENPEKASDPEFIVLLQKKERELEQKMYEWEILADELEELKSSFE